MAIRICPKCYGKCSTTRNDCVHCGYVFEQRYSISPKRYKMCPECGERIDSTLKECSTCGYKFDGENQELEPTSEELDLFMIDEDSQVKTSAIETEPITLEEAKIKHDNIYEQTVNRIFNEKKEKIKDYPKEIEDIVTFANNTTKKQEIFVMSLKIVTGVMILLSFGLLLFPFCWLWPFVFIFIVLGVIFEIRKNKKYESILNNSKNEIEIIKKKNLNRQLDDDKLDDLTPKEDNTFDTGSAFTDISKNFKKRFLITNGFYCLLFIILFILSLVVNDVSKKSSKNVYIDILDKTIEIDKLTSYSASSDNESIQLTFQIYNTKLGINNISFIVYVNYRNQQIGTINVSFYDMNLSANTKQYFTSKVLNSGSITYEYLRDYELSDFVFNYELRYMTFINGDVSTGGSISTNHLNMNRTKIVDPVESNPTTSTPTTTADDSVNEAARKLLANLIFEADGTAVTGDVALPAYLASGETQVTINWESDSELVKVGTTVDEAKGVFTGTVSRPEDETVRVTLTASITFAGGEARRQFTVLVNPYTVSDASNAFTLDFDEFGEYTLPTVDKVFSNVKISYVLTPSDIATFDEATSKLTITSVDSETTITLTATFTLGEETTKKVITLTIKNKPRYETDNVEVAAPEVDKVYFLGVKQNALGQVLYANGTIGSNRLNTTVNAYEAATVTAEAIEGKYAFKFANGKYLSLTSAGKLDLADEAFAWTYDAEHAAWVGSVGVKNYFFGAYSNYNTISASSDSYIGNDGQWKGALFLTTGLTKTKEEKLAYEYEKIALALDPEVDSGEIIALPTVGGVFEDVKAVYALTSAEGATIEGGKITFGSVDVATKVNFTVTLTCGDVFVVKDFYFEVQPVEFLSVTDAISAAKEGENIYIQGIVTSITATGSNPNCWITDGENDFELFGAVVEGSPIDYADIKVGDVIKVSGKYTLYNSTTHETSKGSVKICAKLDATDAEKVMMTAKELTDLADSYEDVVDRQLATAGTVYTDVALSWAVKGGNTATVSITENKLSVTQTDADQEVTLVATITKGEATSSKEVKVLVKKISATKTLTLAYSDTTTTTNMDGTNQAALLGLNATLFSVVGGKESANNNVGLNKAGQIRLYGAKVSSGTNDQKGNTLTISLLDTTNYKLDSIKINFGGTVSNSLTVGETEYTPTANGSQEIALTANSVTLQNTVKDATIQIWILSIEITYTKIA